MNVPANVELKLKHMFCFLEFKKNSFLGTTFVFHISEIFEQSNLRDLENDGQITSNCNSHSDLYLF